MSAFDRLDPPWGDNPYDKKHLSDVLHDFAVVRGDLITDAARDQLYDAIRRQIAFAVHSVSPIAAPPGSHDYRFLPGAPQVLVWDGTDAVRLPDDAEPDDVFARGSLRPIAAAVLHARLQAAADLIPAALDNRKDAS